MKYRIGRRRFLGAALAAGAAPVVGSCGGGAPSAGGRMLRSLGEAEARTLEAVLAELIPADGSPGAVEAGVLEYMDRILAGPWKDQAQTYRDGLAGIEESSRTLFHRPFGELAPPERAKVLSALEDGTAPGETWKRLPPRTFFGLVVDHALQGFYGDPRHGGNRDAASWTMLALPYPPVRGRRRTHPGDRGAGR